MPKAFLSYSWDPEPHPTWVRDLAARLRHDGVETILDQWHAVPGDSLSRFMEQAVAQNDFVIIVCTPNYKRKSDARAGGVGYEGDIMTGEVMVHGNRRKFVPVLRDGEWPNAAPSWLLASYYVDLRGADWGQRYALLVDTLHDRLPEPPPVRAQAFRILSDNCVLDGAAQLVWANCRDTRLYELQEMQDLLAQTSRESGWQFRLPTDVEVTAVQEAEQHYARPPILVTVHESHPFFGAYDKGVWTPRIVTNARKSDPTGGSGGFNANAFYGAGSGYGQLTNINPAYLAVEADRLRRKFLARFVRSAEANE